MKKPTLTGEFSKYKARPVNPRWACSAIAKDGSTVFSGWNHDLKPARNGHWQYKGRLSGWGGNKPGNNLLRKHLRQAYDENLRRIQMQFVTVQMLVSSVKRLLHVRIL
jgi:hypothetical protein